MPHTDNHADDNLDDEKSSPTDPHPPRFSDTMAEAARRMGFEPVEKGTTVSGHALVGAMGGVRGIIEAVLPGLVFLMIFTVTRELIVSLVPAILISAVFAVIRIVQKQPLIQAISGLVGIVISAALALLSGQPENFYLPGFITNAVYGFVLLVSVLVRWPLIGLLAGFLMGDGVAWRKNPTKYRVLALVTVIWVGMFALRLAVQLPLYFAGNIEVLGATRLLMGIPLYAPVLILSWIMVRSVYRLSSSVDVSDGSDNDDAVSAPHHVRE